MTLSNFLLAPPVLAGDYNDDGLVDAADYIVWRKFAGTDFPLPNETASPGDVDDETTTPGSRTSARRAAAAVPARTRPSLDDAARAGRLARTSARDRIAHVARIA